MRLAILIAAICAGLAAGAYADGKEERKLSAPGLTPLEATGAEAAPIPQTVITPASHEPAIFRFGATYSVMPGSTALACEAACDEALSCQAWTFVEPYGAAPARCELKRGQGRKEENPLATSGVATKLKTAFTGEPDASLPVEPAKAILPGQLQGGPKPAPAPSSP